MRGYLSKLFKTLYEKTRVAPAKIKINSERSTVREGVAEAFIIYIDEPSIPRLKEIGFKNDNRGYRKEITERLSIHCLPTSQGWQVHIDKLKRRRDAKGRLRHGGSHSVQKNKSATLLIKQFIEEYEKRD